MFRSPVSRHPLLWGTVVALCAALGGQGLMSAPVAAEPSASARVQAAPAPVSGYRYVERVSAFNSTSARSAVAPCPSGKVVLAGGARIEFGGRSVLLRGSYPVHSFGDRWIASAEEFGNPLTGWRVRAYAVCANRPAGLTYHQAPAVFTSSSPKSVQRHDCPAGTRLIGLGARVSGADNRVGLNAITITPGLSASARASEASATPQRWALMSHVVCAGPLTLAFRQTSQWISPGSSPSATAIANCPQGTRAFGTGVLLAGSSAALNRLVPVALYPAPTPTPPHGTATVSELVPGTPLPWALKAQVICAR